jgi:hypothetical protein
MAAAQLAGEYFLVALDRVHADQAGQLLTLVPGLATSTATRIARRVTQQRAQGTRRSGRGARGHPSDLTDAHWHGRKVGGDQAKDRVLTGG